MYRFYLLTIIMIALFSACKNTYNAKQKDSDQTKSNISMDKTDKMQMIKAPIAKKEPKEIQQLGRTRIDNYAWLKDKNWQAVLKKPEILKQNIRKYLEAENAYTNALLEEPTQKLQKQLYKEMKSRIKEDDNSYPQPDGEYSYYVRYIKGGEYPVYVRKSWNKETRKTYGEETILLDVNKSAKGKDYYRVSATAHSPNHQYFAYAVDEQGSEYYQIRIVDLITGKETSDIIQNAKPEMVWSNDSKTLLWVWQDDHNRGLKVFAHKLGEPVEKDALLYEEKDPVFSLHIYKTKSNQYFMISTESHTTSEVYFLPMNQLEQKPKLIAKRTKNIEYDVIHHGDQFYIRTNIDHAEDFKVMTAPVSDPKKENWKDFIPYQAGRMILDVTVYKDFLIRYERENALPRIIIHFFKTGKQTEIDFSEEAYALYPQSSYEYDTPYLRFSYSSLTTPQQLYEYNVNTDKRSLLKTKEIPSGHIPSEYITKRLSAKAHDGESIPVTLLYKKTTALNGSAPLYLHGYGSYGVTITPNFRTTIFSLIDRGYIFAIAHIRGGQAKGYNWYKNGKLDKKTNTFKDFISVAEMLIQNNYTQKGRIIAVGHSAGGLLMGAVANMRPDLFGAIIAGVPFVDVINTISDAELPLTPTEWSEWGNPIKSKQGYDTIMEYSPYDNIQKQNYPAMFITGGLTDPRVTYWEPAKWTAKIRTHNQSSNPIYLKINMGAGHGGASGRFKYLEEIALEYAFILKQFESSKPSNNK